MPYVKPQEMVAVQAALSERFGDEAKGDVPSDINTFMERHPISGDKGDESPFAKVDGVWIRKESAMQTDWEDPENVEWTE